MSQPSRNRAPGPARRRKRDHVVESVARLEERCLLAPFVSVAPRQAVFVPDATLPPNVTTGGVTVGFGLLDPTFESAAPFTTVSQLAPSAAFGGDIVKIEAGPGGDFGKGVYAISRGAGGNIGAINRPGVIYRVDPATGRSSVFFDLNTVVGQLSPGSDASNSVGGASGLVNYYDLAFDPEGYFDGRTSLFVSTVDRADPNKNAIYRIAPDGTFLGAFVRETDGLAAGRFNLNPSAILIPPTEQQFILRGLIAGSGSGSALTSDVAFSSLFFDANAFRPGQDISSSALPEGVTFTNLFLGPQVGLTAANPNYSSPAYAVFSDFGTPEAGGIPARVGFSGIQGFSGELAIANTAPANSPLLDLYSILSTDLRRFQDTAFDQYGYFSQGVNFTGTTGTLTGQGSNGGIFTFTSTNPAYTLPPNYAGSLFVSDLASGLSVAIPVPGAPAGTPPVLVPVQASGRVRVTFDPLTGEISFSPTDASGSGGGNGFGNLGGRIIRITPEGTAQNFAEGFNTSGSLNSDSFVESSLTITFSADGTTLYASDDDGIWQFKTTASLAGSTSGSLVGLNDLRSLGVPYEGQDSAIAVLDTGVDATTTAFRGRVAPGTNVITNGVGNDDLAAGGLGVPGTGTGTGFTPDNASGHGTEVAGVVAQFVPQSTIVPVGIFNPFQTSFGTSAVTTSESIYQGLDYIRKNPFVQDPVRPNKFDRIIATTIGFGTPNTFDSEGVAYRRYSQVVIAFKNQLRKFRKLGIAPIGAAGQFGAPPGAATNIGGTFNGTNNAQNINVGDVNGITLPAILNEVISVTGTIPFPYTQGPTTTPDDPITGVFPRPVGPFLIGLAGGGGLFGGGTAGGGGAGGGGGGTGGGGIGGGGGVGGGGIGGGGVGGGGIGGGGTGGGGTGGGGTGGGGTGGGGGGTGGVGSGNSGINGSIETNVATLLAGNINLYRDRLLASSNRNITTDFAAPGVDIPTFRSRVATDGNRELIFDQGGTSLSAGIVTGSYAIVSSALDYFADVNRAGTTADAYLTQPVGARTLNFGVNGLRDLTAYATPDGINAILAWTAVPVLDANDGQSNSTPQFIQGSTSFRSYARVDVGNAIAAIEGQIALQYLLDRNIFDVIDGNKNGLITAQEIQTFVDQSAAIGLPEAGAMARFLGGTDRQVGDPLYLNGTVNLVAIETPDQPDVLQRRFNFFDFAGDGQLNGVLSIAQIKVLAHNLLPLPDAAVIVDRQRASANGFLLAPTAQRNFKDLQRISPKYQFVPKSAVARFRGISPARFKVGRGETPGAGSSPVYTLFQNRKEARDQRIQTREGTRTPASTDVKGTESVASGDSAQGKAAVPVVPIVKTSAETTAATSPIQTLLTQYAQASPAAAPATTVGQQRPTAGSNGTSGTA